MEEKRKDTNAPDPVKATIIQPEEIVLKDSKGRFLPGYSGPGRPKGTPNKVTKAFKEYMEDAILHLQSSATAREKRADLIQWAEDNPDKFYLLAAKLLPVQLNSDITKTVTHELTTGMSYEQLYTLKYGTPPPQLPTTTKEETNDNIKE